MEIYVFEEVRCEQRLPATIRIFSNYISLLNFCYELREKSNESIIKDHVITANGFIAYAYKIDSNRPPKIITEMILREVLQSVKNR